jgi:hypothetical protein
MPHVFMDNPIFPNITYLKLHIYYLDTLPDFPLLEPLPGLKLSVPSNVISNTATKATYPKM